MPTIAEAPAPGPETGGERVHGCEPRNFLQSCLLLLLIDGPAHGYELIRRLTPYDVTHDDPGHVYRGLRSMEGEGLVSSTWTRSDTGPSRRVYDITRDGRVALETWNRELGHVRELLERFLADCALRATRFPQQTASGQGGR
jgi:PadR family transcriptional regulator, regulatory protein PadR